MRFQQAKDTLETWSNSAGYCALALLADLARLVVTGWMIVVDHEPSRLRDRPCLLVPGPQVLAHRPYGTLREAPQEETPVPVVQVG